MSIITDMFFGGAEKDAAKAQTDALREGQKIQSEATEQARQDVMSMFPQSQESARMGFQNALNVFNQALPQQTAAFQQGNLGAQQALQAGLSQQINALLGGQIDLSGIQPVSVQPDMSFASQNILLPFLQDQQQESAGDDFLDLGVGANIGGMQMPNFSLGGFSNGLIPSLNQSQLDQINNAQINTQPQPQQPTAVTNPLAGTNGFNFNYNFGLK